MVNGTPDAPRTFEFEVLQRLPEGVTVNLVAHLALALKFGRGKLWQVRRSGGGDSARLHLPKQRRFALGKVVLPGAPQVGPDRCAVSFRCHFELRSDAGPDEKLGVGTGHSLAIRQLRRGEEVGRITWRFR